MQDMVVEIKQEVFLLVLMLVMRPQVPTCAIHIGYEAGCNVTGGDKNILIGTNLVPTLTYWIIVILSSDKVLT